MAALQSSLFDDATAPALGRLSEGLTRTQLDAKSWVDHRVGWVSGSDALFETVAESASWRTERRQMYDRVVDVPRLVSWYDADAALPHARHARGDRFARCATCVAAASPRWRRVTTVHAWARRLTRYGRGVPAPVGAFGAQDHKAVGFAHLDSVPPAGRAVTDANQGGHCAATPR